MRLATIQTPNGPRAALLQGTNYIELNATDAALPTSVRGLLEGGPGLVHAALESIARRGSVRHPASRTTVLTPIPDPTKVVCVGLNYRDHAEESGTPIPTEPVIFSKFSTALIGPDAAIVLPPVSNEVDFEAELVLVIGKAGRFIKEGDAMKHLAGYSIGHDVSARDWQLGKDGKQWLAGKSFDTFAPVGPVLVTADEIPDPCALGIRFRLNGVTMQDSNTSKMIFTPAAIISYVSQFATLAVGDLIFTGTPPGVGMARKPPVWLKPGDVCEVEIDGLGILRNPVVQGKAG